MKNFYSILPLPTANLKAITSFFLVLCCMFVMQKSNAQEQYRADGNSQINISVDSSKYLLNEASGITAHGSFILEDGKLDDISAFKLKMPINLPNGSNKDSISFEFTNVMVLPIMRKVHFVGYLNIAGVSTRTELDFNFSVNSDKSITLVGDKAIKLNEYRENTSFAMVSYLQNNNDLKLNMTLNFKNQSMNAKAQPTNLLDNAANLINQNSYMLSAR
jgi:hypothetical protein